MHLWDAYTGHLRASYAAHNHLDELAAAYSVVFSSCGTRLIAGYERALRLFDVSRPGQECELRATRTTRRTPDGQWGILAALAVNPDMSGMFAAGSYAGSTCVYDERAPGMLAELVDTGAGITRLRFSADGMLLYAGARRSSDVVCWDVRMACRVVARFARAAPTNQRIGFDLLPAAGLRGGAALITGSADGRALVYDAASAEPLGSIWVAAGAVDSVAGAAYPAAAAAQDGLVLPFVGAANGSSHEEARYFPDSVCAVSVSAGSRAVLLGTGQRHFRIPGILSSDSDSDNSGGESPSCGPAVDGAGAARGSAADPSHNDDDTEPAREPSPAGEIPRKRARLASPVSQSMAGATTRRAAGIVNGIWMCQLPDVLPPLPAQPVPFPAEPAAPAPESAPTPADAVAVVVADNSSASHAAGASSSAAPHI